MASSCVRPSADKIVVKPGEADDLFIIADLLAQALDGGIEFKQHSAGGFVPHHALYPKKRRPAAAAGHCGDVMAAGSGIEHQIAGGELDLVAPEDVFDHQFAAIIVTRIGEE